MPHYEITAQITGTVKIYIDAPDESEALIMAEDKFGGIRQIDYRTVQINDSGVILDLDDPDIINGDVRYVRKVYPNVCIDLAPKQAGS